MAEKTKKVALSSSQKKRLIFAGAQSLMGKPQDQKQAYERKVIHLTAEALKISPFGVNILGNLPYTNNLGRKEKMKQYDSTARFEYEWVQYAKDDLEKAICKARVVTTYKEKVTPLTDWVIGECSPKTIKMGTLAGYQNHMAQTRAANRAFEEAYGNRMRLELFENVQRMTQKGTMDEAQATQALNAGTTSAEEAVDLQTRTTAPQVSSGDVFTKAKRMIQSTKNPQVLLEYLENLKNSKVFNVEQKKELNSLISQRVDILNA